MPHHEGISQARRIDLAEAKKLFDAGQAAFIDVRKPEAYDEAHVPGAIAMPLRDVARRYPELPRDRQLVFY